jgi:peroxiredoxin
VLGVAAYALLYYYPKPQIASAAGRPAPDFTLRDQDGQPFTLSTQRGKPVLIYFYRGHW